MLFGGNITPLFFVVVIHRRLNLFVPLQPFFVESECC